MSANNDIQNKMMIRQIQVLNETIDGINERIGKLEQSMKTVVIT